MLLDTIMRRNFDPVEVCNRTAEDENINNQPPSQEAFSITQRDYDGRGAPRGQNT